MPLDYNSLGIRIKKARKHIGLTQERLAEHANISSTHLSNIENGKTPFSLEVFVALADALSVRPDELLCDSVEQARYVYFSEAQAILNDCTKDESRFVIEMMETVLKSYRNNANRSK